MRSSSADSGQNNTTKATIANLFENLELVLQSKGIGANSRPSMGQVMCDGHVGVAPTVKSSFKGVEMPSVYPNRTVTVTADELSRAIDSTVPCVRAARRELGVKALSWRAYYRKRSIQMSVFERWGSLTSRFPGTGG